MIATCKNITNTSDEIQPWWSSRHVNISLHFHFGDWFLEGRGERGVLPKHRHAEKILDWVVNDVLVMLTLSYNVKNYFSPSEEFGFTLYFYKIQVTDPNWNYHVNKMGYFFFVSDTNLPPLITCKPAESWVISIQWKQSFHFVVLSSYSCLGKLIFLSEMINNDML